MPSTVRPPCCEPPEHGGSTRRERGSWCCKTADMRITALAGGVGGARFLRGLRTHLDRLPDLANTELTIIGNTGDDISM